MGNGNGNGNQSGGGMSWAQVAIMAASTAMQGIGAWLGGGGGEERKPFTQFGLEMGDNEAKYVGDMMKGMLEDARMRGFAKETPRVDFDIPGGYTRTAPLILGYSGRGYTAGGGDRGMYAATQTQPGLGAPWAAEHRAAAWAASDAEKAADDAARAAHVAAEADRDPYDRTPYVSTYKGLGSPGTFVGGRQIRTEADDMRTYRSPGTTSRSDQHKSEHLTWWTRGGQNQPEADGGSQYEGQGGYEHQASGGQYGQQYEAVKALRDSVASRGKLERGDEGAGPPSDGGGRA